MFIFPAELYDILKLNLLFDLAFTKEGFMNFNVEMVSWTIFRYMFFKFHSFGILTQKLFLLVEN